jgi:TolB protein
MNRNSILLRVSLVLLFSTLASAQNDWIRTGTGLGIDKPRIAVADFKAGNADPATASLQKVFNDTLWNDLSQSGILEVVSKSFYPLQQPGTPEEVNLGAWANDPAKAAMLAFGNLNGATGDVAVMGWLYDVTNTQAPQILGKQYREKATEENARLIAHRFANEIIFRLGGGVQGIFETKIYYVRAPGKIGNKEIWVMDYDGNGAHPLTQLGTISLSPRPSPDNSRVAFSAMTSTGWQIRMYSLELGRMVSFAAFGGTNMSPAWSHDGRLAFSSSRNGDPEIYVSDAQGSNSRRITAYHGPDVAPTWNPKTGAQIAWVSGRSGLPHIYLMEADGSNPQELTEEGYAVSPSWSPNGQFLTFAWIRHYGPGAPGAQDIYIFDLASKRFVQLTHGAGRNDSPSWSPDGRHIVFQSNRSGNDQIWTMLADGTEQHRLTRGGVNTQPSWSWK